MPAEKETTTKQVSFEVAACLVAALNECGSTVGTQHFRIMAKIDDSKTESGYQHFFRPIKTRAKEIADQVKNGELGDLGASPAKTTAKKGKKAASEVSAEKTGEKRGRKTKDNDVSGLDGDDEEGAPKNKKVKNESNKEGSDLDGEAGENNSE